MESLVLVPSMGCMPMVIPHEHYTKYYIVEIKEVISPLKIPTIPMSPRQSAKSSIPTIPKISPSKVDYTCLEVKKVLVETPCPGAMKVPKIPTPASSPVKSPMKSPRTIYSVARL